MMEHVPRGWQASTAKIRNRLKHVFTSMEDFPADIHFKVGRPDDEVETIGAHKMILAASSEVFYAMMYGPVAEKRASVPITDVHPTAFREMLRFMYTDRFSIDTRSENIQLTFRTMECARKYDIPQLYFACRSLLLRMIMDHKKTDGVPTEGVICTGILTEALVLKDQGLVKACYRKMFNSKCCPPCNLDVQFLSHDVLCQIVSKKDAVWTEKELYDLCYRWAKFHCGENATPETIRKKLDAVRQLIRYSLMSPTEISDGPVDEGVLTSEEALSVYRQKFGSDKDGKCLFDDEKREEFESSDDRTRFLSIAICHKNDQYHEASTYQLPLVSHHETSLALAKTFKTLIVDRHPIVLCVDGVHFDHDPEVPPRPLPSKMIEVMKEEKVSPPYLMEGDVALAYEDRDKKLILHVVTKACFTPANWLVVAHIPRYLQLIKCTAKMIAEYSSIMAYHKAFGEDQPDEDDNNDSDEEEV